MARAVFERSGPVNRPSGNRAAGPLPKGMTISDRDLGARDLIVRMLEQGAMRVGVSEASGAQPHGEDGKITVGEIATIHEFGLGVPRRSFLSDWFDERRAELENMIVRAGRAVVLNKLTVPEALEQLGLWCVGSIQTRIAENIPPPLAPETIARKGSSVALIDKGQLRASITHEVNPGKFDGGGV
jgi:hypothetical protein